MKLTHLYAGYMVFLTIFTDHDRGLYGVIIPHLCPAGLSEGDLEFREPSACPRMGGGSGCPGRTSAPGSAHLCHA